jgi:hypothetical protein
MRRMNFAIGLICILATAASMRAADTFTVTVNDNPSDWTVAKIKTDLAADITKLEYTGHDGKHTSSVVPLISVLKAAGVDTALKKPTGNDPTKHAELHFAIIVQGRDGYSTLFSIGELMADLANRPVFIALDVDGKPWPAAEAPVKLIVPEDQKPARWVHSVQAISVVNVQSPATQPVK